MNQAIASNENTKTERQGVAKAGTARSKVKKSVYSYRVERSYVGEIDNYYGIKDTVDILNILSKINMPLDVQENFCVTMLNASHEIIAFEKVHRGTKNSCSFSCTAIFRTAIMSNACSIILSHNHPSGNLKPSASV